MKILLCYNFGSLDKNDVDPYMCYLALPHHSGSAQLLYHVFPYIATVRFGLYLGFLKSTQKLLNIQRVPTLATFNHSLRYYRQGIKARLVRDMTSEFMLGSNSHNILLGKGTGGQSHLDK